MASFRGSTRASAGSIHSLAAIAARPIAAKCPHTTGSTPPHTTRMLDGIRDLDRADAIALFGDAMEGASYLDACERSEAGSAGTSMLAVYRAGRIVAAAPVFRVDHRLDIALGDRFRAIGDIAHTYAPRLLSMPVLCLGTRTSEECPIGFRPSLSGAERDQAFKSLLDGLSRHASTQGIRLLAIKDFADSDTLWGHGTLQAGGFTRMPSPPIATLHLPFADEAGYFASLSANARKSWKRRLKAFASVDVEIRNSIDGIGDEIVELFEATKARRKTDYGEFSDVPPAYFREVVEALGERAVIVLTRVDGALASFSLSIVDDRRLVGKYVGMRYPLAQEHDIYYLNWLTLVRYCLQHRIRWMQVGQTCYLQKARLGCQLKRSWVYVRHTGAILGPMLRLIGPHLAFDAMDPDLQALGAGARYLPAEAETGAAQCRPAVAPVR